MALAGELAQLWFWASLSLLLGLLAIRIQHGCLPWLNAAAVSAGVSAALALAWWLQIGVFLFLSLVGVAAASRGRP